MSRARTDAQLREFIEANSEKIPISGCWIWLGGLNKDGYGQASYQCKNVTAHRVSFLVFNGAIRDGLCVMHQCDVRSCVNPYHLTEGTSAENTADKVRKGRARVASGDAHYMRINPELRSGERGASAKLIEAEVREIIRLASCGVVQTDLAAEFEVSRTCISAIVTRRNWKHLNV
jgi:hypothetical protein